MAASGEAEEQQRAVAQVGKMGADRRMNLPPDVVGGRDLIWPAADRPRRFSTGQPAMKCR